MMMKSLILLIVIYLFNIVKSDQYAVLIAGSASYMNYRHQSDIMHAHRILKLHGFPDDHIILMIYGDIMYDRFNPYPGNVANIPDGANVYNGVIEDYSGSDLTYMNIHHILTGNKTAMRNIGTSKVLESTSDDDVFIYYSDHGGSGVIALPEEEITVQELNDTLSEMHFKRLVFYLEACESGSMFDGFLSPDGSIYAVSASTPFESSYAIYYDPERQTYLGDVFSVNWMQDTDMSYLETKTLNDQFLIVRELIWLGCLPMASCQKRKVVGRALSCRTIRRCAPKRLSG